MKKDYVSVIVPVYNNEACLARCIESIMKQTYKQLQIILIDDGSADASGEICDKYAKKDSRIEVYHLSHAGVSHGRNIGIEKAVGEYIQFVDGDDMVKLAMTEHMAGSMKKSHSDMVVCNYIKDFQTICVPNKKMEKNGTYSNVEYICNTLKDPGHHYYGVVWNKLYRTEIIKEAGLRFLEDINLGEDFIFNLYYLRRCRQVYVENQYLYKYNKVNGNTLSNLHEKTLASCEQELSQRKVIFSYYEDTFRTLGIYEKYERRIYFYWIIFYVRQVYGLEHEYKHWCEHDKNIWKERILTEPLIRKSRYTVPNDRIKQYAEKYRLEYQIKKTIKTAGGIH